MNEPERLTGEDLSPEAHELLRALERPQAPTTAQETALVQRLTELSGPTAWGAAPAAAGMTAKLGVLAGFGALVLVGLWVFMGRGPAPAKSAPAPPPPGEVQALVAVPLVVPRAPAEPPTVAPAAVAPVAKKQAPHDALAEEEALLEKARHIAGASPAGALALLQQHRARFPRGQLVAERMFLSIEVLGRLGDQAGAEREVQALLTSFPRSSYAAQLRARANKPASGP